MISPLPSAPAVPPVPLPAPSRSPFLYLVTDPWIAISWLVLIGTGMISVLLLRLPNQPTPPSASKVISMFLFTGYIFWSSYFGLAACWRLALRILTGTVSILIAIVVSMLPPGWIMFFLAFVYAWLGGGIYQFARRWWLLAHGQRPPFLTIQRQVTYR